MPLYWNAQLLRLTLFLHAPIDGSGLWRSIVGEDPSVDENRPREGVRQITGQLEEGRALQVTVTSERLDVILVPTPPELVAAPAPVIGEVREALGRFDGVLSAWLGTVDFPVLREAFGLVSLLPTPDRDTAYERLAALVPSVRYDAANTREVVYQVNRPQASRALPRTTLNRITKWSAMVLRNMMIPAAGVPIAGAEHHHHCVRCECDNSTPADRTEPLPVGSLKVIYEELRDMALQNLERGEMP